MPCYEPIFGRLRQTPNGIKGRALFDKKDADMFYYSGKWPEHQRVIGFPAEMLLSVPFKCRKCYGCKKERARQWSIRCVHEASLYERNCFVTLTFNNPALKERGHRSVDRADVQKFIKRLRKRFVGVKIRTYYAAEYGKIDRRPHYHILLFNIDFDDKVYLKKTDAGSVLYTSETLSQLWRYGYHSIGALTPESAAYCAQYTLNKMCPHELKKYGLRPEFQGFSNRPGLGKQWLEQNWKEVYPLDECVVDTYKQKPPEYYDRIFKTISEPILREVKAKRLEQAEKNKENSTYARLQVRLKIAIAKSKMFSRGAVTQAYA